VEFGASNLTASDTLTQHTHGMVGALVIEPPGSKWELDPDLGSQAARVTDASGKLLFDEFVVIVSDDLVTGKNAINYGSEPTSSRFGGASLNSLSNVDQVYTDDLVEQGPDTPVFAAELGKPVRFRLVQNAGNGDHIFVVHGHSWPERPYGDDSTLITTAGVSAGRGARMGVGPSTHYDIVIDQAGGKDGVPGDYLYRAFDATGTQNGLWGIMCVRANPAECAGLRGKTMELAAVKALANEPAPLFVRRGNNDRPENTRFQRAVR
jgi:FtsP/CotA-like multicopper oxidase with cupredoxin domain